MDELGSIMNEYGRDPCPWRIVDECGAWFLTGLAVGSIFHAQRIQVGDSGYYRLRDVIKTIRLRAPITGGRFAMWGFSYNSIDCMLMKLRKKEDPWNAIISGGATGALMTVRAGAVDR